MTIQLKPAVKRLTTVPNIGVVGYRYWGPNLVRNFAETPGINLAAVSDLDAKNLELVQKRWPAVKTADLDLGPVDPAQPTAAAAFVAQRH